MTKLTWYTKAAGINTVITPSATYSVSQVKSNGSIVFVAAEVLHTNHTNRADRVVTATTRPEAKKLAQAMAAELAELAAKNQPQRWQNDKVACAKMHQDIENGIAAQKAN